MKEGRKSVQEQQFYAIKHKNLNIRMNSRSGGFFTSLSDYIIEQGGIVYGCILNEEFEAEHIRADNFHDRDRMRGSKYIQSDIKQCYIQAKKDLEQGKIVLFTGTPCQIAGLKAYLNQEYDKLITMDIICHGVPSPLVWKDYIVWNEKKYKGVCVFADFRDKKNFGWRAHFETLELEDEGKRFLKSSDIYAKLFYSNFIVRPACYACPYKCLNRVADITIGDFWGIEKAQPEFDDNKGISLVIINGKKGIDYLNKIRDSVEVKECVQGECMQEPLITPYSEPHDREKFWEEYAKNPFSYIVRKYGQKNFQYYVQKAKCKITNILKRGN